MAPTISGTSAKHKPRGVNPGMALSPKHQNIIRTYRIKPKDLSCQNIQFKMKELRTYNGGVTKYNGKMHSATYNHPLRYV